MQMIRLPSKDLPDVMVHVQQDGTIGGPPVVFSNSLGTDLRLWDKVIPRLPPSLHIVRYDKRGHGLSSCPSAPYTMGTLVRDAEQVLDTLRLKEVVFVGLSIGGMIAQGLAVKRLDLVRGIVLSNTAAKIGQPGMWRDRVDTVQAGGVEALADAVMDRWFSKAFLKTDELAGWRNMLTRTSDQGYIGCCQAISGTDFYTPSSGLRLPTLGIAGTEDGATPPDLVRETVDLIPGSEFHLIRGAGHLPPAEAPKEFADAVTAFLKRIGHV
jgi:3-oxoadipate enol-lactonase